MSVSVITSVWNRPDALGRFLECILDRDVPPEQIIIVDDGSDERYMVKQRAIVSTVKGGEYIYFGKTPKLFRKAACMQLGVTRAKKEFVACLGIDHIFPKDYLQRCIAVMQAYKNMVLFHRCENMTREQGETALASGKFPEIGVLPVHALYTGKEPFWSTVSNIHPTLFDCGCDGCSFMRTEQAQEFDVWDPELVGWGGENADLARTCLENGISPVAIWDIASYHIDHEKSFPMYMETSEQHDRYLQEKWGGRIISSGAPLIPVTQEDEMRDDVIIPEPPNLYTNPAPMPSVEWVRFPDDLSFEDFQPKMEAYGFPHTPVHGQALFNAAKSGPGEGYIVEFGSWWMTGASYLAAGSKTVNREKVISVDIDRGHQFSLYSSQFWDRPPVAMFRGAMNLIMVGVYDWVIPVRSSTWEFLDFFSGAIRALHFDASHTYEDVRAEVMKVKPFLIQGAIVIFHDRSMEGVARAIHEFIQEDEDFTDVKFLDNMTALATRL